MIQVLKPTHPTEKVMQEIEAILLRNNMRISFDGYHLKVNHNDVEVVLIDGESKCNLHSLPREIESEVFKILEK